MANKNQWNPTGTSEPGSLGASLGKTGIVKQPSWNPLTVLPMTESAYGNRVGSIGQQSMSPQSNGTFWDNLFNSKFGQYINNIANGIDWKASTLPTSMSPTMGWNPVSNISPMNKTFPPAQQASPETLAYNAWLHRITSGGLGNPYWTPPPVQPPPTDTSGGSGGYGGWGYSGGRGGSSTPYVDPYTRYLFGLMNWKGMGG
jgi:hypothetical protein